MEPAVGTCVFWNRTAAALLQCIPSVVFLSALQPMHSNYPKKRYLQDISTLLSCKCEWVLSQVGGQRENCRPSGSVAVFAIAGVSDTTTHTISLRAIEHDSLASGGGIGAGCQWNRKWQCWFWYRCWCWSCCRWSSEPGDYAISPAAPSQMAMIFN